MILAGWAVLVWTARIQSGKDADYAPPDVRDFKYVPPPSATTQFSNNLRLPHSLRLQDMTPEQRAELADKFEKQFKPALEKWCKAYGSRAPFKAGDVTLNDFRSHMGRTRLGTDMWNFTINGTDALLFMETTNGVWVGNVEVGKTLQTLNSLPALGGGGGCLRAD